uniref:TTF-type domain-containing protein n=1 Tax=Oryzias latipes TaxID=8090 RepID=A0A3B3HAC2_ORYLA
MKRKSTNIYSYFKKKRTAEGGNEMVGEQQRNSEEEKEEDETEQHDQDPQSALTREDIEGKKNETGEGQSASSDERQISAKAGARPIPGLTDISQSRAEHPKQPHLKCFPRTYQGDRRRCFSKDWYNAHKWLEYSQSKDSAFCYACRHFGLPASGESVLTSEEGFKNWKKATFKDGGLLGHARSEAHTTAMLAWAEYEKSTSGTASLSASLDAEYSKLVKENREYIKVVGETLLLTATQNIAQRGHKESEVDSKGNFLAIMELLAKNNPIVKRKMAGQRNATCLGHDTQNEMIDCLAEMVRSSITGEVAESEAFSILVDETKDMSKKEQMSFVIRYYYNGSVCECFLAFEAAQRLNAAALSQKIIEILQKHGLDYKNHLVGQAYDGASVMSGKNTGVQARIKSEAPLAFYVHCNAHCLNLVLVDSVKFIPEANCFFSLLQKLYVFVSGSYVHQRWLEIQREMSQGKSKWLKRILERKQSSGQETPKALLELTVFLEPYKEVFHQTFKPVFFNQCAAKKTAATSCFFCHNYHKNPREIARGGGGGGLSINTDHEFLLLFFWMLVCRGIFVRVKVCRGSKKVEKHCFKLCKVALALPVSTASCERSFSTLKLIKTALRSTISDERLSNLGVLSVESRRARAINLDDFVDVFAKKHSNRRVKLF